MSAPSNFLLYFLTAVSPFFLTSALIPLTNSISFICSEGEVSKRISVAFTIFISFAPRARSLLHLSLLRSLPSAPLQNMRGLPLPRQGFLYFCNRLLRVIPH